MKIIIHLKILTNIEDIWIENDLFDDDDKQAVKNVSKEIIDISNPINDTPIL